MTEEWTYLDHAATTPLREAVAEAMARHGVDVFGNPSSVHRWGRASRASLEEARERLAAVVGATRREVVFTGGGTEADNLAVLGRWRAVKGGVVCSAVEHKAVLGAARAAGGEGAEVLLLGVDGAGRVEPESLDEALRWRPAVVSVMWGNNEVGTLQPVEALAERCRAAGVAFHSDAVQALGRVPIRMDRVPVDLLSVSAHKVGGPKGVGALVVRDGVKLEPLVHGGGQESGLRPGTQNVAGAVGLAVAAELAESERSSEALRLAGLRDRLGTALRDAVPGLRQNGAGPSLPHILNVSFPSVDQEMLLASLDMEGIGVASGSACQSGTVEPSHVLVAMGAAGAPGETAASVRFSLGRTTVEADVERAVAVVPRVVERLRSLADEGALA